MEARTKSNFRKVFSLSVKLAILAAAFWFIYKEIFVVEEGEQDFIKEFKDLIDGPIEYNLLAIVFVLVFFNWGFESLKWKSLIDKVEKISIYRAFKAIFSGVTVSIFTPNRVGEYVGRVFHLQKADRINAILITMICGVAQLLVTVATGLAAGVVFMPRYTTVVEQFGFYYYAVAVLVIAIAGFLLFGYLNASLVTPVIKKIRILGKWRRYGKLFARFSKAELLKVLLYSFGRYAVFTLQFYLLLRIFGVHIGYLPAMMMISLTYFVMAIIPTIAIAELGVRGSVAVYFLGMLSPNEVGILSASFALWIVNLALPALLGSLFIFNLKFFKQE